MKIRDLLESVDRADIPSGMQDTMPPALSVDDMDQYYEYYRFAVAIAGMPENDDIPIRGPINDNPWIAPYTDVEHDHAMKVLRKMGKNPKHLTKKPSTEPSWVNKSSPVRQFKDLNP
jgi:hypothetical protein